ncbi:hypothetical protein I4F81_005369 [Pyropia yezoensis]|uniref:Uncharacterized protein n=1 Tax=Pyropia yezoensis TaxID=2788 RepID=A0ACC3BY16_PYRYE|nr:hypothetical protein I4F81_005369 [Neopyropia yezoensis]
MRIAVQGCAHGELDAIYATIRAAAATRGGAPPPDLLLCCGDFQCTRDAADLATVAVPARYARVTSFSKYHSGAATAPVLTVFVGGNHEASAVLAALPLGGWVAPNIYYLGVAGGVTVGGLRLGGLSGICKDGDYRRPRSEVLPYSPSHLRSVYHVREEDVKALLATYRVDGVGGGVSGRGGGGSGGGGGGGAAVGGGARQRLDVFMSHDWPAGVTAWGDADRLVRCKPFFRDEVARGALGSAPGGVLLAALRPRYWFAGHLHVKFTALVPHPPAVGDKGGVYGGAGGGGGGSGDGDGGAGATPAAGTGTPAAPPSPLTTRFLALDKVLPNRDFLQLLDIPTEGGASPPSFAPTPATATAADAAGDGAPPPAPPPPVAPLTITRDPAWLAVLAAGRVAAPPSAVAAMVARLAAAGVPLAPPPLSSVALRRGGGRGRSGWASPAPTGGCC